MSPRGFARPHRRTIAHHLHSTSDAATVRVEWEPPVDAQLVLGYELQHGSCPIDHGLDLSRRVIPICFTHEKHLPSFRSFFGRATAPRPAVSFGGTALAFESVRWDPPLMVLARENGPIDAEVPYTPHPRPWMQLSHSEC